MSLSLVAARSPARARLADLIAARNRVSEVLEARRRDSIGFPYAFEEREEKLEAEIRRASTSASPSMSEDHYRREETAARRAAALIRGDDLPEEEPTGDKRLAALRVELEELRAEMRRSRMLMEKKREDVAALERELGSADGRIVMAAKEVVTAESDRAAIVAEYEHHAARAAILGRALDVVRAGNAPPDLHAARNAALAAGPCPWAQAAERLRTDPDAPMPTIEAALAAVGGPGPSARDAE
ncbi:hypothetical protein [Methylobacterium sp. J-070]|uniref:hypothetical protein n=1 Tax=Methylobacterium sp. J-070 TaxID=2836650 RepID=UPI001FBB6FA6|nr:hypothetical protein [Methylobacterium sp. J-070]MCJ2053697.1 hypothetical protein [Methylobacterium sp. J-070]